MPKRFLNGATVRALRESLGIKHGVFARDVLVSTGYLSNIEAGRKQPDPAVVRRIATRLGVEIDAITYVSDDGKAEPEPEAVPA